MYKTYTRLYYKLHSSWKFHPDCIQSKCKKKKLRTRWGKCDTNLKVLKPRFFCETNKQQQHSEQNFYGNKNVLSIYRSCINCRVASFRLLYESIVKCAFDSHTPSSPSSVSITLSGTQHCVKTWQNLYR